MTQEQKAKAYDKALERAKQVRKYSSDLAEIKRMEDIFPELKESEDEKIREILIEFFEDWRETKSHLWGINVNDILAWLEKLKVFAEYGDGLCYFGNNGFTYFSEKEAEEYCKQFEGNEDAYGRDITEIEVDCPIGVKEVDLKTFDMRVTEMWGRCAANPNDTIACLHIDSFIEIARHFFELGLTQKGE